MNLIWRNNDEIDFFFKLHSRRINNPNGHSLMSNSVNTLLNPTVLVFFKKSPGNGSAAVTKHKLPFVFSCLGMVLLISSCASTQVTTQPEVSMSERLPKPDRILVYDFVPTSSANVSEQVEIGREIAVGVVNSIREMGLSAEEATPATMMQINDIVLKGSIVSVSEGSAAERVALGFGAGASELKVQVEGYQMTPQGLRRIGGGTGDAGGSKTPGAALGVIGTLATANPAGLIVSTGMKIYGEASGSSKVEGRTQQVVQEIADRLKIRFQQQGWIP